jgi:hypothetical protein
MSKTCPILHLELMIASLNYIKTMISVAGLSKHSCKEQHLLALRIFTQLVLGMTVPSEWFKVDSLIRTNLKKLLRFRLNSNNCNNQWLICHLIHTNKLINIEMRIWPITCHLYSWSKMFSLKLINLICKRKRTNPIITHSNSKILMTNSS